MELILHFNVLGAVGMAAALTKKCTCRISMTQEKCKDRPSFIYSFLYSISIPKKMGGWAGRKNLYSRQFIIGKLINSLMDPLPLPREGELVNHILSYIFLN